MLSILEVLLFVNLPFLIPTIIAIMAEEREISRSKEIYMAILFHIAVHGLGHVFAGRVN